MAHVTDKLVPGKRGKPRKVYIARWKQDGKTREKSFAMQREAKSFAAEMQARHEDKTLTPLQESQLGNIPFEDLAEAYLAELASGYDGGDPLEPQTLRTYRGYLEAHVYPFMRLKGGTAGSLTREDVADLRDKTNTKIVDGRNLAPKSVREVLRLTKAVLTYGVSRGHLSTVPGKDVTLKVTRAEKAEAKLAHDSAAFTPAQVSAILRAADSLASDTNRQTARAWGMYRPLAYLLALTGMRISEARGFPRDGFDKANRVIHIRQRAAEKGEIGHTKSADGIRKLPLDPALIEPLESLLRLHSRSLLFSGESGTPKNYQNLFNRMWKPLLVRTDKLAGTDGVKVPPLGFHALRHAYAARLIAAGANLKQLQTYMGHHDPAFTLRVYGHLMHDEDGVADLVAKMALP